MTDKRTSYEDAINACTNDGLLNNSYIYEYSDDDIDYLIDKLKNFYQNQAIFLRMVSSKCKI